MITTETNPGLSLEPGDFLTIPVAVLPLGEKLAFDLYIELNGNFALYASAGSVFDMAKNRTAHSNNVKTFYAKRTEPNLRSYYESNLSRILREDQIQVATKAQIFYDVATHLVKDILEDPRSGTAIKRSKETVRSLVDLVLTQQEAFFHLLRITSHDYYTYTHSVNVCTMSIGLARRLGAWSRPDYITLGLGALLHDVGKCWIDLQILNKPGALTDEEWQVMRKHPEWGAQLLSPSPDKLAPPPQAPPGTSPAPDSAVVPAGALRVIEQHHESCSGHGYPYGLSEREIDFFAKIVKIADIYDALTTNRSYRKALTPFQAIQCMQEFHAQHIDARLFREFILLLGHGTQR